MRVKWIIIEKFNLYKFLNVLESSILEYKSKFEFRYNDKILIEELKEKINLNNLELLFFLKEQEILSNLNEEIEFFNYLHSSLRYNNSKVDYSRVIEILFSNKVKRKDFNYNKKNVIIEITDDLDFMFYTWENAYDIKKIFVETLDYYEIEDFFENKEYKPENIFDINVISFLDNLSIDHKSYIIDKHNEEFLNNCWTVYYIIKKDVSDDFIKNIDNEDHIAYDIIHKFNFEFKDDQIIYEGSIEGLWTGEEINPLDDDVDIQLENNTESYFYDNAMDIFNENLNILDEIFNGDDVSKPIITYKYFPEIDKIIKK